MSKRKKKSIHIEPQNNNKLILIILAVLSIIFISLFSGYYFGYEKAVHQTQKLEVVQQKNDEQQRKLDILKKEIHLTQIVKEDMLKPLEPTVTKQLQEVLKKENSYISASHEFDTQLSKPPENIKRDIQVIQTKAKLAIIIDDVSTKHHVDVIKSLNFPITMSFLPPSKNRPNSAKLASKEKFYMVHLPMEAQNFTAEEPFTLRVKDSQSKILSRIEELKKLFPRVKYINNHTGSKFTSNEKAMNRLIYSLNKNSIDFIDSRTTAKTKAPMILKRFGKKYVARDIFLDHHDDTQYILKQIKKVIALAKKHGSAIAIGHPHSKTMAALKSSKKLFDEVELVYVDKVY